jgi:hypothetical protein
MKGRWRVDLSQWLEEFNQMLMTRCMDWVAGVAITLHILGFIELILLIEVVFWRVISVLATICLPPSTSVVALLIEAALNIGRIAVTG